MPGVEWLAGLLRGAEMHAVFLFAFIENVGLPIPALPVLALAGALARAGGAHPGWPFGGAALGAVLADLFWYQLGRWRGRRVLAAVCRLSLKPEACVHAAEGRFRRRRIATILLAKFVPGLNAVAPPLAGSSGMPLALYLAVDAIGCLAWAGVGVGTGWLLGGAAIESIEALRSWIGWAVFAAVLAVFLWNGLSRFYLVRRYAVPRVRAADLHRRLSRGEDVLVVDLRSDEAFEATAAAIPAAVRIDPASLGTAAHALPPDRELVFYCSCRREASSARVARALIMAGRRRIAVLEGGFEAWVRAGLPTQEAGAPEAYGPLASGSTETRVTS